jgi:hypothetical protein
MTTAEHDLWVIRGIMADLGAAHDLSPAELRALLAVLAPAHARVLALYGPAVGIETGPQRSTKLLRIVPTGATR